MIGLPPQTRVKGVDRHNNLLLCITYTVVSIQVLLGLLRVQLAYWQLLCPKCNDGPLVLHEQPIGIGVVGFHSVHTRYVIIVSLYIVFNLLTKIIAFFFLLLSELL